MSGSAVDVKVNGSWGRKDGWDDLVLINTLACPPGSSAPEVLSRVQDGWERGTICVSRWTGQDTARRRFFQSSPEVCVPYRGYWRGKIDLHMHTNDVKMLKWWQEVLVSKAAVCTKESSWEIVPLLPSWPWPDSCSCITYQTQCAARNICVAVFRHLQTNCISSGRGVSVVLNLMLDLKAFRSLTPNQVQDILSWTILPSDILRFLERNNILPSRYAKIGSFKKHFVIR